MAYTISVRCPNCARKMSYTSGEKAPEKCDECVRQAAHDRAEARAKKMAGE